MDNIRNVIKILFRYTSPKEVLLGTAQYDKVREKSFSVLANRYMPHYSNNEIANMFHFLGNEFEWHHNKMRGREFSTQNREVNVFDAIWMFADAVLVEENNKPLCAYEHLLRWRDMMVVMEEDLFIAAFFAQKDIRCGKTDRSFFWPPAIGHNNSALNRLMEQGVAENHFHMKGSAPLFHLSWISMMNDVLNPQFKTELVKIDERRLHTRITYHVDYAENSLWVSYLQAALIRIYLFFVMQDKVLPVEENMYIPMKNIVYSIPWQEISDKKIYCYEDLNKAILKNGKGSIAYALKYIREQKKEECSGLESRIAELISDGLGMEDVEQYFHEDNFSLKDCLVLLTQKIKIVKLQEWHEIISEEAFLKEEKAYIHGYIKNCLNNPIDLEHMLSRIQKVIAYAREEFAGGQMDYMLCRKNLIHNPDRHLNEIISGERWFMYEYFMKAYRGGENSREYLNLFYVYLLMKENIRAELIQSNNAVGFDNFLLYQDRKEIFIDGTPFEEAYVRAAVRDTILNQHVLKLEARITPKRNVEDNINSLKKYYKSINIDEKENLEDRYFFVMHFVKEPDQTQNQGVLEECRHYSKRIEVYQQAMAIAGLRQEGREIAERVLGIDSCSPEIGCRPEVFAQAFRYLKNHTASYYDYEHNRQVHLPNLGVTYHAGEDFLDVIDGLRAIDEAMSFLNMRCGDRLGHALALGVDVSEWYDSKSNSILISQMDYLDNLVWLYSKIRKYRIEGCEDTVRYIEKRYNEYFRIIYLNNINNSYMNMVLHDAQEYYASKQIQNHYNNSYYNFTIDTYYDAWKLRGDNPDYFKDGFFKLDALTRTEWDEYGINKEFPDNYLIRYNPESALLYHLYHFSPAIKNEGRKTKEIKVNPCIVKAVKAVQKKMQQIIARMGIGIETNPSSNILIGTFKRYDKHPILKWYNLGLATSPAELADCSQIQVSINTDDQGVFATYIENEYAYLTLALEKMKDEQGNPKYNRTLIYQWIDNVRKMGLSQCFAQIDGAT